MMLLRILAEHPEITSIVPVSRSQAGTPVCSADPGVHESALGKLSRTDGRFVAIEESGMEETDAILSALPHAAAAKIIGPLVGKVPVVDLSADFRLNDASVYERAYGVSHPHPDLLSRSVYGLTEWNREAIRSASIIASPGCYPTATLLPLLPFRELISGPVIVNALSGISGAGRKERQNLLFGERSENVNAYNPGRSHRHVPEIEQELGHEILFTPHLVPIKQGMIATIVTTLDGEISEAEARERLREAYGDSACVSLSGREIPESRDVRNTNRCDLGVRVHGRQLQLFSALDNLYKGAAGQVIQNLNVRLGLPETRGLRLHGEF